MVLFEDEKNVQLLPYELEIKKRYSAAFALWLENPSYNDKQIVRFLVNEMNISAAQAYRDIPNIKILLGNVKNATKEWYRYVIAQGMLEAYQMAKKRGDVKGMALAYDKLGRYTRCDQDDADGMRWDEINPPNFEPIPDPTLLNRKYITEEYRKQLRAKYKAEQNIEDAEIIDE